MNVPTRALHNPIVSVKSVRLSWDTKQPKQNDGKILKIPECKAHKKYSNKRSGVSERVWNECVQSLTQTGSCLIFKHQIKSVKIDNPLLIFSNSETFCVSLWTHNFLQNNSLSDGTFYILHPLKILGSIFLISPCSNSWATKVTLTTGFVWVRLEGRGRSPPSD